MRLTAPDGYTAIAVLLGRVCADGSPEFDLTVERLPDGEVSTFLHDEAMVGDELEVRGPIGGWFVWKATIRHCYVGGGSGVVPLMAMLRLSRRSGVSDLLRLVVSVRTRADLYYADELPGPETSIVYTRTAPAGSSRLAGRLNQDDLEPSLAPDATVYICGSSPFADAATETVVGLGTPLEQIRIERFGPTG